MLKHQKITDKLIRILNAGCDVYLIDGDIPLMIDCGCCKENIKEYAESLIQKSVEHVLITHSHIDHCGHAGLFPYVYMTEETYQCAKNPMDEDARFLHLNYQPVFIHDEQMLLFGNTQIEVLLCDTHCLGNAMFLDHTNQVLFTGDEIDQDQVLLLPSFAIDKNQMHSRNAATVYEYQMMLKKVWERNEEYKILCTGHNGSPLKKETILKMIELCQCVLNGEKGKTDCSSLSYAKEHTHFPYANANYRRFEKEGLALVYCEDDLFDSSNNNKTVPATKLHEMCAANLK